MNMREQYERLSTVSINEVLPLIDSNPKTKTKAEVNGTLVKVSGLRLLTFKTKGQRCSTCKLEATYFAIERNGNPEYHLNLWGVDSEGRDVLFTHDHTLARSLGGKDNIHNTVTMCWECNQKKAKVERAILNKQKGIVSKVERRALKKQKKAEKIKEKMLTDLVYRNKVEAYQASSTVK